MVKELTKVSSRKYGVIIATTVLTILALAGIYKWRNRQPLPGLFSRENGRSNEALDPYQAAVQKIEEDRGEPTGNKAEINVPAELKLYKERSRFLDIQVDVARRRGYELPHDFSQLASMIQQGEFIRLPTLGPNYVLYGVGIKADDEFTHYDSRTGKSIPLFSNETELEAELSRLSNSIEESKVTAQKLKNELAEVKKDDRASREEFQAQIARTQKSAAAAKTRRDLINAFYQSEEHRRLMMDEYQKLSDLARSFDGRAYDLNDSASRKNFKISLLSTLRPTARAQLEEIGRAYQERFGRPLPVTSLVRTVEYQRFLGESGNPNAIQIDVPPHTTGLAFDIYTYYMAANEQQFLMDEIARLEREGRVEALREKRFHIHVFALAEQANPSVSSTTDAVKAPEK